MIRFGTIRISRADFSIAHGDKVYKFEPKKGRNIRFEIACHLLLGAGYAKDELFNLIYGGDIDGGPISGLNQIEVTLSQLGRGAFAALGIELRTWRLAGINYYKAVVLSTPYDNSYTGNYTQRRYVRAAGGIK